MSALNVIVRCDAAHLITDAAGCVAGRLLALTPKTFLYPHLGIAAGFRGHIGVMRSLSFLLGQYPDRVAMVRGLPHDFRREYRFRRKLLPSVFDFDIGIIGFDGRPFGWLFSSVDRPGFPAFRLNEATAYFSPTAGDEATERAADLISEDNVDEAALAVLDGQRLAQDVVVGGYAQITSVDEDGINTRLLCRWSDERGKVVDRSTGRVVAVKPSVTSRPIQRDWRAA
ncbi:hypothetical protein BTE77_02325 [Ensifer adhaerens]|nr:hypothetical protein BTE77_02325 [Ensifer adhaerens]